MHRQQTRFVMARSFPRSAAFLVVALMTASVLFVLGVTGPTLTIEKFIIAEHTFSIVGGIVGFWKEQQWFVLVIVTVFSLCFPVLKILALAGVWFAPVRDAASLKRWVDAVDRLGRWSMLDVFVVAVLVASVKLGAVAQVSLHTAIYAFAACVLLTMAASHWTGRVIARL